MKRNFGWAWFPVWLVTSMGLVFLVNVYMIWTAVSSFPGAAGRDGFELSNDYGRVLRAAAGQSAMGWQVDATVGPARRPVLRVTDRTGQPLGTADVDARAERPVGPAETTALRFLPDRNGRFMADLGLRPGQWDVLLTIRAGGQMYTATRRLVVN
jgi:nitrogen fixation protein FixH